MKLFKTYFEGEAKKSNKNWAENKTIIQNENYTSELISTHCGRAPSHWSHHKPQNFASSAEFEIPGNP